MKEDKWGDIDPDWFDPSFEDEDGGAEALRELVSKALNKYHEKKKTSKTNT